MIVMGRKRPRLHPVDVQDAVEVIDLVLKDSGIPTLRLDHDRVGSFVQTVHMNTPRTRDNRCKTRHAEATFEEFDRFVAVNDQLRINYNVERYWPAFPFSQLLGRELLNQVKLVLDYRELNRQSDLWSRQTDTGSIMHGLAHGFNEVLGFAAQNLFCC